MIRLLRQIKGWLAVRRMGGWNPFYSLVNRPLSPEDTTNTPPWWMLRQLGGLNPLYSPSALLIAVGQRTHTAIRAGFLQAEKRQREIDQLPEPERTRVRQQEFAEVAERASRSAAQHLSGIPWFANPYFPMDEDQTPEEFDAVMAEWRRSISSEEREHDGGG